MSANGYLTAAAGQLQNAAQAVKQQIDNMRADYMTKHQQVEHDITSTQSNLNALSVQLARAQDPGAASHLNAQVQNLQQKLADKKAELKKLETDFSQAVKGKEGTMSGLQNQASGLQSQARDPSLA